MAGNPIKFNKMSTGKLQNETSGSATMATRSNSHAGMQSRANLKSRGSTSVFKQSRGGFTTGGFSAANLPSQGSAIRPHAKYRADMPSHPVQGADYSHTDIDNGKNARTVMSSHPPPYQNH